MSEVFISRNCPNCGEIIDSKVKFCPYCGASVKEQDKKRRNKIIIGSIIFFVILALFEGAYNLWVETKMSKPFSYSSKFGDTNVSFLGNYNKDQQKIRLTAITDQKIKSWQTETGVKPEMTIEITKSGGDKEIFKQNEITFKTGEFLSAVYITDNASLKDYIKINKLLKDGTTNGKINIIHSGVISFDIKQREKFKKEYFAAKERERQRRLQAEAAERQRQLELQAARQRLYNYLNYGYYGYY